MTNLKDLALKPRAVAVLVALRRGTRSTRAIADAIADPLVADTIGLLQLMATETGTGYKLVQPTGERYWGLTYDGVGWLQSQGLDATASREDDDRRGVGACG